MPAIGDLIMEIQETSPSLPKFKPKLIIHGGAGNILRQNFPPDKYEAYRTALISIVKPINLIATRGDYGLTRDIE